jgi:enoyl-CoA hydratase/carnithine racemase
VIVAAQSATFGSLECDYGVFPYGVGSQYLARTAGKHRALWLMMTGETIDATTALEWGLVNVVVPDDECVARAVDLARQIASHAPLALGVLKYMTNKAVALDQHYDLERALGYHLLETEDTKAAFGAWLEQSDVEIAFRNG